MKKFKIFISLLLAISLLPVFPAFAADEAAEYELVELTDTEAFAKLEAFGIMTAEDEIVSAENVSRAQFMMYVMKCWFGNGISADSIIAPNPFSDIDENTAGAAEISAACKLGIISAGDKFRPDDPITMPEAAKILVSVLGYGEIAANRGGYPTGYLTLAAQNKLFEGAGTTAEGYITVNDFAQILVNTLEADVLELSAIWENRKGLGSTYTAISDRTLLEYAFGIYRTEGIVESNEYTSLHGITTMYDDRVEIGGMVYKDNGTFAGNLLGYNTELYYSLDKPEANRVIEYIAPFENEVITVVNDDIAKDAVTATNFAYYREDKDRIDNEAIPKSATLIYNGGQKSLDAASLCPANGTVTLIDNNDDGNVDVVSVMNYRTILVSSVSVSSGTVADMLGGESIVLDSEDDDYDVYIEVDGTPADISAIGARSIISYAASEKCAKNVKYAMVSNKKVSGTPESIGEDTIVINGNEYYIDKNLIQTISLRDTGVFYLDFTGKIVAKKLEKDVVYGYLNNVIKEGGLEERVRAQIFTENDRWVELDLKEKITYTKSGEKAEVFYDDWKNGRVTRELITYTVDADGKINMIKLADNSYTEYSDEERDAIEQDVFRVYPQISSATYHTSFKNFSSQIHIDDATKIFAVPDQSTTVADLDDFSIIPISDLIDNTGYTNLTPYDYNMVRVAGAVVLTGHKEGISRKASFMLVDSIVKAYNSVDKAVDAIKGYYKGSYITLPVADDTIIAALSDKPANGDVVRFRMDANGDIAELELIYDYGAAIAGGKGFIKSYKGTNYESNKDINTVTCMFLSGTGFYTDASANKFVMDVNGRKVVQGTDSSTLVSIYDTETEKLIPGSLADLENGNDVLVRSAYGVADEIIVYH